MNLDLDLVERKAIKSRDTRTCEAASPKQVLALLSHIRALHTALLKAAELVEGTVSTASQHDCAEDDPDWQEAQRWRELVTRGAVMP